jgi:serine/threonine protein kinase/Tfp pilus assembly protein PilF
MIGQTISHYKIVEKIGAGGMGVVYKAEDTKLKRTVALKFLPQHLSMSEEEKKRFIHEARASAALDHPNICNIHEINETEDGRLYIVMACYEGESLKDRIKKGPLGIDDALDIARQIAEGLHKAHQKDIVHRDIKPANIFITSDGLVKILDFGLAKLRGQTRLTKAGTTMGTIAYMSPEQAQGEGVDQRTDLWSLGVVLYEMVTGELPFKGEYEQAIIYSIMNEEPGAAGALREGVSETLQAILDRALAKDAAERFQTAAEFRYKLQEESGTARLLPPFRIFPQKRKTMIISAALSAVLIVLAIAGVKFFSGKKSAIHSLAVLPFQNLSGDAEQEFFVNGMHESLLTELSKIKALRVISRTSVLQFKEAKKSIPEIARELNVEWIIEGSAVQVGDTVRINAQLIDAEADHHLWAENYDRPYRDVLNLHSQLARDISREIKITLAPEDEARLAKKQNVNPEAHKLYLKGQYLWNKYTPADLQKAREHFRQAIKLDPRFAPAYTGLFRASFDLAQTLLPPTDQEAIKKAKEEARYAAQKAMELDSGFSEAHTALATIRHYFDWDWEGARKSFERALELNPNDVTALIRYADYLLALGEHDKAIRLGEKAVTLDPLAPAPQWFLSVVLYHNREYDRSSEICKKNLEFNANSYHDLMMMGWNMFLKGDIQKAQHWWADMHECYGNKELAEIFRTSTWEEASRAWLDQALSENPPFFANPDTIAWVYAVLGKKEEAFRWLERGIQTRRGCIIYIGDDPAWDFFRSEPRFQEIVRMMELPEAEPATSDTE